MLKFRLNCIPTAQARARHMTTKSGLSVSYKSANQKANERTLEAMLAPYAPKAPLQGPLVLEFVAALPVGKSDSKKLREAKLTGLVAPEKKPDILSELAIYRQVGRVFPKVFYLGFFSFFNSFFNRRARPDVYIFSIYRDSDTKFTEFCFSDAGIA